MPKDGYAGSDLRRLADVPRLAPEPAGARWLVLRAARVNIRDSVDGAGPGVAIRYARAEAPAPVPPPR